MFSMRTVVAALWISLSCEETAFTQPQPFSSGSTGADGALNLTTPGTVYFNPADFTPPLDPAGDNIYNFTTITIGAGVTVKLTSKILKGPIYWLAQGAVTINGTIDLSGEPGAQASPNQSDRIPAAGGAGGYGGGVGGYGVTGSTTLPVAQPGEGPGGGTAGATGTSPGTDYGGSATFTGGQFLVPLIGGSGGGGGNSATTVQTGSGGGGGGGALLIASSTSITINSTINANGGAGGNVTCVPNTGGPESCGGGGSGGAIRLVSNSVTLGGGAVLEVVGGQTPFQFTNTTAAPGHIRIETNQYVNNGSVSPSTAVSLSVPFALALPATKPAALTVTSINGIPINANPFSFPDATINTTSPVTVSVQAQYVPPGTVPTIYVFGESGPDQTVPCSGLAGTLSQSTCTASIAFVTGGSRGFVKATW